MAENNPDAKASVPVITPFDLVIRGLRDLAGMELPGLELPALPCAIPVTMRRDDGIRYLVGLDFAIIAEAEQFAAGLEEFVDRVDARLLLKRPAAIIRDAVGNCFGVN